MGSNWSNSYANNSRGGTPPYKAPISQQTANKLMQNDLSFEGSLESVLEQARQNGMDFVTVQKRPDGTVKSVMVGNLANNDIWLALRQK